MEEGKRFMIRVPEWAKKESDGVMSMVVALLFTWEMNGGDKIDNLQAYLEDIFDDESEADRKRVAELLVQHGILKYNRKEKNERIYRKGKARPNCTSEGKSSEARD